MKAHKPSKAENQIMKNDETKIKVAILENNVAHINETLLRLEKTIDQGFGNLNNKIDSGFEDVNNRIWFNFYWMLGGFVGVLVLLAHSLNWL